MSEPRPVYTINCPDCDWQSREFNEIEGEIAATVDAGVHYVNTHGGQIPDGADFGKYQCSECDALAGLDGTVSCSECGYIPPEARA